MPIPRGLGAGQIADDGDHTSAASMASRLGDKRRAASARSSLRVCNRATSSESRTRPQYVRLVAEALESKFIASCNRASLDLCLSIAYRNRQFVL